MHYVLKGFADVFKIISKISARKKLMSFKLAKNWSFLVIFTLKVHCAHVKIYNIHSFSLIFMTITKREKYSKLSPESPFVASFN